MDRIKILIVGSQKKWAIENFYHNYLIEFGHQVDLFPAHDLFDDYYHHALYRKLLVRSGISSIYRQINQNMISLAKSELYDIIWVFKGMEIYPATIQALKAIGAKLVNYNPDHPFVHTFRGSGNRYVRDGVKEYDAHFCYSLPVLNKIEKEYSIPCRWLPFAYEPMPFEFPKEESEILKACFIGNPDPYRAKVISELNELGISIDLYGNSWSKFITPSASLKCYDAIYKADFNTIAPLYRLHLNIFRPHNDNSHNMRTFEMPGIGSIVLAPWSDEHMKLFKPEKEIFLYNDISEMGTFADKVLNMSYIEALAIRKAAYNRCLQDRYSYKGRSEQVNEWFKNILNEKFTPFNVASTNE